LMKRALFRGLRAFKWRLVVPAAFWLGLPQERVANAFRLAPLRRWVSAAGASGQAGVLADPDAADAEGRFPMPPPDSPCQASMVAEVCRTLQAAGHAQAGRDYVAALIGRQPQYESDIRWGQVLASFDETPTEALVEGERILRRFPLLRIRRGLYQCYNHSGNVSRSLELAREIEHVTGVPGRTTKILEARQRLLARGAVLPGPARDTRYAPRGNRVLYLLHNSLPHDSGGYATRTHGLVRGMRSHGWDVECATRLGYPKDIKDSAGWSPPSDEVDGVLYHRLREASRSYRSVDAERYLALNAKAVEKLARKRKPEIIHGASNHINGIAAVSAARRLGIPAVFEVRGLWELTRISRQPAFQGSELYNMIVKLETQACLEADRVITITEGLKELLVSRGVPQGKIVVVANGTDTSRFKQDLAGGGRTRRELGIPEQATVFGYVGSMPQYEGLDDLIRAVARLDDAAMDRPAWLLLVGDGDQFDSLQELARQMGVSDRVKFTGRVPHDDVDRYYAAMDALVFPRKPQPVTETVSPMKPFEAMAMGKPVIASNVAALAEIVEDGETGLLFSKGSVDSLAERMMQLVQTPALGQALSARALTWVREHRDWRTLSQTLVQVYREISVVHPSVTHPSKPDPSRDPLKG